MYRGLGVVTAEEIGGVKLRARGEKSFEKARMVGGKRDGFGNEVKFLTIIYSCFGCVCNMGHSGCWQIKREVDGERCVWKWVDFLSIL